jgi:AbrB family transcriptional regulator (stage V sporulation protein T)
MVVSASGAPKKELWEKSLSPEIDQVVQARQTLLLNLADGAKMLPITVGDSPEGYTAQILTPILVDGEVIGALMLLSRENGVVMTDIDMKVAETTATIVGRQMEQ